MQGLDIVVLPEEVDSEQGAGFWDRLFMAGTVMVHKNAFIVALHAAGKTLVARYWESQYEGTLIALTPGSYTLAD